MQPVQVQTLSAKTAAPNQAVLSGKVLNYPAGTAMKAACWYRAYNGQMKDLYAGPWKISPNVKPDAAGNFKSNCGRFEKRAEIRIQSRH